MRKQIFIGDVETSRCGLIDVVREVVFEADYDKIELQNIVMT